jgi:hypothetical protein
MKHFAHRIRTLENLAHKSLVEEAGFITGASLTIDGGYVA